jgi:hypothetical protein
MSIRCRLVLLVFSTYGALCGCSSGQTVDGPETDKLLPTISGYLVMNRPPDDIVAIRLPDLAETVVRPTSAENANDLPSIHAVSGPDAEGHIAYIEDHFFVANTSNRRHLLKTIKLNGTQDTELFSSPGDAMWAKSAAGNGGIGSTLALSPIKGRVAFLSGLSPVQMPTALLHVGTVEIWDIAKKTGGKTKLTGLDEGLAWFPDGKRLAYVKLVELPAPGLQHEKDNFGAAFRRWEKIPAVFIHDTETGKETVLHAGWRPIVAADGQSVLLTDLDGNCRQVEVATGKPRAVTWQGNVGGSAIALPFKNVALALCLPTAGTKVRFTKNNSPLRGPKQMLAIKLARIDADDFQTIVPFVDPRDVISFGQVKENAK